MTTATTPHSHGAVVPQSSRAEWFTSFDVDAFEVPGGREEIWRFTPMKRLRGLHSGVAATATAKIEVTAGSEHQVETVRRGDERLGVAGTPADRIAAHAWCAFDAATVITLPSSATPSAAIMVTVTGPGQDAVAYGHLQIRARQFAEGVVVIDHRGSGTYADNVEFVVDDGARLNVIAVYDWADDVVHVSAHHAK